MEILYKYYNDFFLLFVFYDITLKVNKKKEASTCWRLFERNALLSDLFHYKSDHVYMHDQMSAIILFQFLFILILAIMLL